MGMNNIFNFYFHTNLRAVFKKLGKEKMNIGHLWQCTARGRNKEWLCESFENFFLFASKTKIILARIKFCTILIKIKYIGWMKTVFLHFAVLFPNTISKFFSYLGYVYYGIMVLQLKIYAVLLVLEWIRYSRANIQCASLYVCFFSPRP